MRRPLLHHLRPVRPLLIQFLQRAKGAAPSELCSPTPSGIFFFEHAPCARSSITSESVDVFYVPCTHARNYFNLPLLRFAIETQFDLHSPARLERLDPTLNEVRIKVQLLSLLDALYAEIFNCTRCRNLLAQAEKQLKLILSSF